MADNTVNVDLKLRSNISSTTAEADKLAGKIDDMREGVVAYNRARAIGSTSSRSFAKESEGLGGIVRSYAIIAANTYAVTSAFKVLSDAMDTTIMVKSMDKLGAASGMALGTLSKRLVEVSDGALSIREAMEAVSKGSAAGMTGKQLEDLTKIAGNASKSLGINMTDAMSRLVRGVSKLEPELLDELGIFTKIEPAVNEYARSIGKSASSLTDFERRQAFLVAVIAEGNNKFKEAQEVGVNVYTKLGAALKNNLLNVLESINVLLTPIVSLLAQSPTALYAVLAGIGALLLKQIIPAITEFRAGVEKGLNTASLTAIQRVKDSKDAVARLERKNQAEILRLTEAEADAKLASIDKVEKRLNTLQRRGGTLVPGVKEIIDQNTRAIDITDQKFQELRKQVKESGLSTRDRRVQYDYINALEASRKAEEAHSTKQREVAANILASQQKSLTLKAQEEVQNRSIQKSVAQLNYSEVARTTQQVGFLEAVRTGFADIRERRRGSVERELPAGKDIKTGEQLYEKVEAQKLGLVSAAFQRVGVAVTAAGTAMGTLLAATSPYLQVAALLIPVLAVVYDRFVGNIKYIQATSEAYDKLSSTIKNAYETIQFLGKNSERILSVDNLNAAATALQGTGEGLFDFIRKAQAELGSGGKLYNAVEAVQGAFGFGTKEKIKQSLTDSINVAVQLVGTNSEPLRVALAKALDLSTDASTTFETIARAAKVADPDKQIKIAQAINAQGIAAKAAVQPTKDLLDAFTQTAKVFDNIISSILPSTGLGKWAYDGIVNMQAFRKEIGDVATDIGALNDIIKNPADLIKKFGIEGSKAVIPLIPQIQELNKSYTETVNKLADLDKTELQDIDKRIASQQEVVEFTRKQAELDGRFQDKNIAAQEGLNRLIKQRVELISTGASKERAPLLGKKEQIESEIKGIFSKFDEISANSAKEFAKLFEVELGNTVAKANLSVSKAVAGYVQDPEVKAKLELANTKEDVRIQREQINGTVNLIKAMAANSIAIALNTNELAQKRINEERSAGKITEKEASDALANKRIEQRSLELRKRSLDAGGSTVEIEKAMAYPTRGGPGVDKTPEQQAAMQAMGPATGVSLQLKAAGSKNAELDAILKNAEIRANVEGIINSVYKKRGDELDAQLENQKNARKEAEQTAVSEVDRLSKVNAIDLEIQKIEGERTLLEFQRAESLAQYLQYLYPTSALYAQNLASASKFVERQKTQNQEQQRLNKGEKNRAEILAEIEEKYKNINNQQQNQATLLAANRGLEDAGIEASKLKFEAEASLGKFTDQQLQDKRKAIALDEVSLSRTRQIEDANVSLSDKLTNLNKEYAKAKELNNEAEQVRILSQIRVAAEAYGINIEQINKLNDAKRESIEITNSLSVQEKGFADIFTKGFESMADAMAEFVKTGKLDFKSLINSMIMDLIRFQLRSQMKELAGGEAGGANFFAKLLSKALGGGSGLPSASELSGLQTQAINNIAGGAAGLAKGGAFDNGVREFAMGGAFTNSIVRSPTLFKFATGTGLMGEAGPEAIMPLKRDATGTLGVRSSQPKVDIVVNNYSGEKAETRETTDSRGNRKVEVVVGEMSASDISRPGSSSQRALRSNYGLQPALIRR